MATRRLFALNEFGQPFRQTCDGQANASAQQNFSSCVALHLACLVRYFPLLQGVAMRATFVLWLLLPPATAVGDLARAYFFLASSSLTLLSGMRSKTRFFRTRRGTALRLRPALDSRFRRVSTFLPLPGPHFSVELTSGARALRIEVGTSSNNLCRFPLSSCSCPAIFVSSLVSPASVASPSYPFAFRLFLVRISIKIPFLRRC